MLFGKLLCKWRGHKWVMTREAIRKCSRCGREEALYEHRFPGPGEPLYSWGPSPNQELKDTIKDYDK